MRRVWRGDRRTLLGLNTDSVLCAEHAPGIRHVTHFLERYPSCEHLHSVVAATDIASVQRWRLIHAVGLCSCFITPAGARKLVESVFALRMDEIHVPGTRPGLARPIPQAGPDFRLNALYESLRAYVTMPFLAWTPNRESMTRTKWRYGRRTACPEILPAPPAPRW